MTTVNIILLIVAIASQILVASLYINSHFKGPMLDPLDYLIFRRRLGKLFRLDLRTVHTEVESMGEIQGHVRPATIFEKAEFIKAQLLPKLRSSFWRKKMIAAIDNYAEKLSLDEDYSDGAISAIVSHIQNTHKPNM